MIKPFIGTAIVLMLAGCASTAVLPPEDSLARWGTPDPDVSAQIISEMPLVRDEFRAVWVATVDNIDWPSKPGLSSEEQQKEMIALLDRAESLNLNAIVLQIRPTADALYRSSLEPWSYYLTGENGKAPSPAYDPLSLAVQEAHSRGIELHVWFNPYRAYHPTAPDSLSEGHISRKFPDAVHRYGAQMWMDPGSPEATQHTLKVIMDVVNRYDIDGVHLDDYFYPYPVSDADGVQVEFPDSVFFAAHGTGLSRADWRRRNVDDLIHQIYLQIKNRKPWVLFGISPFGIWKPGYPAQVKGFDAFENLYADAKRWLNEGWVDYYTPQLYWALSSTGQPYGALLDWWIEENTRGRHIWPGNFTSRIILQDASHWEFPEIIDQVKHTRATGGATGNVHFSMRALAPSDSPLSEALSADLYSEKAIIPASTWLPGNYPAKPALAVRHLADRSYLAMLPGNQTEVRTWIVRIKESGSWHTEFIPAWSHATPLKLHPNAEVVVLQSVTRLGRKSEPAVLTAKN
ncbi:MAG: family 10 glycosylhydrolase [Bacteroidetes bacterium]|nr:family 10 glycosylhydrolase [Bacteroidota bacterium]